MKLDLIPYSFAFSVQRNDFLTGQYQRNLQYHGIALPDADGVNRDLQSISKTSSGMNILLPPYLDDVQSKVFIPYRSKNLVVDLNVLECMLDSNLKFSYIELTSIFRLNKGLIDTRLVCSLDDIKNFASKCIKSRFFEIIGPDCKEIVDISQSRKSSVIFNGINPSMSSMYDYVTLCNDLFGSTDYCVYTLPIISRQLFGVLKSHLTSSYFRINPMLI